MEIKYSKEQENIRFLFDKLCSLPLKEFLAKKNFKKYLSYEMNHGTPKTQEKVKKLAIEFVNKQKE